MIKIAEHWQSLSNWLIYRPASEEELNVEDTLLLLAVYNHDIFVDNVIGICVVACKDIPRLREDEAEKQRAILDNTAPQRKIFSLSLFHYPLNVSHAYARAELESRAEIGDSKAKQIIKTIPSSKSK